MPQRREPTPQSPRAPGRIVWQDAIFRGRTSTEGREYNKEYCGLMFLRPLHRPQAFSVLLHHLVFTRWYGDFLTLQNVEEPAYHSCRAREDLKQASKRIEPPRHHTISEDQLQIRAFSEEVVVAARTAQRRPPDVFYEGRQGLMVCFCPLRV